MKISALLWSKIYQYECLTDKERLSSGESQVIEQAKFTYSLLSKELEKQTKLIKY